MISYSPQSFDFYVYEAASLLTNDIEAYNWTHKKDLIRRVAAHLRTSYATSMAVVDDLHDQGLLEANNGRFRVRPGSFSV